MELLDLIKYVWIPVVAYLIKEIAALRKEVSQKASRDEVEVSISKYLEPRLTPIQQYLAELRLNQERTNERLNEIILMLASWQPKPKNPISRN